MSPVAMASQIIGDNLLKLTPKKTSMHRITGQCDGNPPPTDEFPSQRSSNAENVSMS